MSKEIIKKSSLLPNYNRVKISFEKGKGSWLYTKSGEAYLDLASGIAVNIFGHSEKKLIQALCSQAKKLWHVSNLYEIPNQERLAQRLANYSNLGRVFFCNSGLEANEAAVKIARRYHYNNGNINKNKIICAGNAFHGRSIAMLAATDNSEYRRGFGPMPAGFQHVAFNDFNELKKIMNDEVAAIMIETVQGEGGVMASSKGYLQDVRRISEEYKSLLIMDEVQCGMGRTGKIFAYEHFEIQPDIVVLAKALGGGFPIGAVISKEEVGIEMIPGTHGSTFGGNPLAMAVGNAILDGLEETKFIEKFQKNLITFESLLKKINYRFSDKISEIRGMGFLRGLKLNENLKAISLVNLLRDEKILTVPASDNVVRLLPPLNIKKVELKILFEKLNKCLKLLK